MQRTGLQRTCLRKKKREKKRNFMAKWRCIDLFIYLFFLFNIYPGASNLAELV